jgi:carbon-monoxide dehydrogenase small subunit
MSESFPINITVNGKAIGAEVEPRQHLADFLRHTLRLTGTHVGCEHGVCGACNVLIDGQSVRSCLTLAVQADGCAVMTVEGMADDPLAAALQSEFAERNALQCGYCTPGMLATAVELLRKSKPTREHIRDALSGNYCRCTGYQTIVDAIAAVADRQAAS